MIYRVKQFLWAITSTFKKIDDVEVLRSLRKFNPIICRRNLVVNRKLVEV